MKVVRRGGLVAIIGILASCGDYDGAGNGNIDPANAGTVGEALRAGPVEVTVTKVQYPKRLTQGFGPKEASEGAVFVAVDYNIKNVSRKPVGMFDGPRVDLVSPDGIEFDWDLDAASSYTRRDGNNAKAVSDLNPGITTRDDTVFEISSEMVSEGQWFLKFSSGFWETSEVLIKIPAPNVSSPKPVTTTSSGKPPSPSVSGDITKSTEIRPRVTPAQQLARLKEELNALNSTMDTQRQQHKKAQAVINRLTNNRRTPVRERSREYYQCLEASKIIKGIERGAPGLKAKKAELEATIEELSKEG